MGAVMATNGGYERQRVRLMRMLALALIVGAAVGIYLGIHRPLAERSTHGVLLFSPQFDRNGLVTNEYAYYNPFNAKAARSVDWEMTSGSLFARNGDAWSGVPDDGKPDIRSRAATNSAVFRLVTKKAFGDCAVTLLWKLGDFVATARTPRHAWDGLHLWLRYRSAQKLYFVSFDRRDGQVVIGKKYPGGGANGGHYTSLAARPGGVRQGRWHRLKVTIETTAGNTVTIRLLIDGKLIARAVDRDTEDPAILEPGRLGVRGDNANFMFRSFEVRSL